MFIQLHLLTSYPPANLNRDDTGRPKTAVMGGVPRLRVSSQALKRAWRTSAIFEERLAGSLSKRTRRIGMYVQDALAERGVDETVAHETAVAIAKTFGDVKKDKAEGPRVRAEQLAFIGPAELEAIDALVDAVASSGKAPKDDAVKALVTETHRGADIALFGRMLAAQPHFNVEAAAEVAHAITVHKAAVEDDFFTAVDDLAERAEDDDEGAGAGFMGDTGFGAGLFYQYLCIDRDLLVANLAGDEATADSAIAALAEAAAKVGPGGKRASFGSRAHASYILAERGRELPRSLSAAFLKPVAGRDPLQASVKELEGTAGKMDQAFDPLAEARYVVDVTGGRGDFKGLVAFLGGGEGNWQPDTTAAAAE